MRVDLFVVVFVIVGVAGFAKGQLFSDDGGTASNWTVAGDGDVGTLEDVRFSFNYGAFDIFGNGFITGGVPEAPRSDAGDAATTGIFLSANNNIVVPTSLISGIYANGVNVGAGTANPDYVLRFDAFHSTTTGLVGPSGGGTTNYQWAGINFRNPPTAAGVRGDYAGAFGAGLTGQTLTFTGDQGSFDDYEVTIGPVTVEDRNEGFTGLATAHIRRQFEANGFTAGLTPIDQVNQNATHVTPTPGNEAAFDSAVPASGRQFWIEQFPAISGPVHFDTAFNENPNEFLSGGTPYNRWATHEVFFVGGVWTYVIDGTVVLQVDPGLAGAGDPGTSDSGTFALGFYDPFSSYNASPDGSNFVLYDNIVLDSTTAADVPDMVLFLSDAGYIPPVPEPAHLGVAVLGGVLVARRRRG